MKYFKYSWYACVLLLVFSCNETESNFVEEQNFNEDWFFNRLEASEILTDFAQPDTDFQHWESVQLPHTPKIEPEVVNNQWQGICWYRKSFVLDDNMQSKKLYLKFEGAMNIAKVWVNGEKLLTHQGGYLPFVVDFTTVAKFKANNTVAVKLDNRDNPVTGPKPLKILDFNTYGGLYRNVWLIAKNPLHITDPILENKKASGGVFVTFPQVSKEKATVQVQTHVKNEGLSVKTFQVRNTLLRDGDEVVSVESNTQTLELGNDLEVQANLIVKNPKLWSPSAPNLYHLKTEVFVNGQVVDQEVHRIGIKTMKFIGQDFYLNGEKTFLRGVNRHQEYPYIGYALSENANYRDAKKIKEAGFDYVRLSHYPQNKAFMDACDELGLATIDAILGWQYFSEDAAFQNHVFQTARDLIRRDRNRASVIAWEVSLNESWMPEPFIDELHKIAHEEYPGDQCFSAGWQSYGCDIYLQARQHRLEHYDETVKKPYNVSEYGDWEYYAMNAGLDQSSWSDLLQEERSSRQLRDAGEAALLQQATNIQEAHNDNLNTPAFADGYWVMFDYNRGYADDVEASGIMDIFRIPKPSYYFYQSQRSANEPFGKPVIHIANQWTPESSLDVRIFSNCDTVELFLNGKSLGRQTPDQNRTTTNLKHPPFTFRLKAFETGKLEAKGYMDDKVLVTHTRRTPQEAAKIEVVIDDGDLDVEANDIFLVHAQVTDIHGTVIPDFSEAVTFQVAGDAELIGENPVKCVAGIASILLKTSVSLDDIKVSAKTSSPLLSMTNKGVNTKKNDEMNNVGISDFFWQGINIESQLDVVKLVKEQGHQIENHSWNHENGSAFSNVDLWVNQVQKTFDEFETKASCTATYYRPPFGAITQDQINFLAEKGIKTVLWSFSTDDWDVTKNSKDNLLEMFKNQLHNGAIVLLHDADYGRLEDKLVAIEQMIIYGKSKGFEFVSLKDVI
ncbi:glycoside hydrolase family 2 TIM barrel-domain containing protein [Pseudotamlana carrageenivorans]|uniref:Glycoside hydrolase family 2 n=1 Tax=Pseudotamlana carrageenivorans TaxID=2069432 RepID=A0A2I7SG65_9FLAO|nr:glycoside hydrolase family 2 TIM barrel-domain containing protein [Tamlana carrageenivorans]AUS04893.1 glycoside hydrolase family 2 [Tamlana carrageenivorans]